MDTETLSIRQKQIEVAKAMINFNSDWQPDWRCLILDRIGQNIIAPLFSIEELKNNNVVQHFMIHSSKDPIPGLSAIYFVMPTDENIELICRDLTNHLYDSYYFNFISPISRSKLETIASTALLADAATDVRKVYDQYLNFIALEDDLFILRDAEKQQISYFAINRSDATETEIHHITDQIVECLFSLLVTINTIPIIRSQKGGAAEVVAEKLCKKIRETLRDGRNNLFEQDKLSLQRPLLCLVDRNLDISTPLHHTWTYQALIADLLDNQLNKVKVPEEKDKIQTYDLNPSDKFWGEQKGNTFPQVAEAVQKELDVYKKAEEEITAGLRNSDDDEMAILESAAKLSSAVTSLPELRENKRLLEKHTNIATAVLKEIKTRKLDNFFEIEEKIMNRNLVDRVTLDDMLANPDQGQPNDKYRLFLIAYICDNPSLTDSEVERYLCLLETYGCNRSAFEYVRSWKTFSRTNLVNLQTKLEASSGVLKTANMFSELMTKGSQFVMEGVKNLVLKEHRLPLTKVVDNLMDCRSKPSRESQEYSYMDPMIQGEDMNRKKLFQSAIVFVVGGGNYSEYQNLVDYGKSHTGPGFWNARNIVYGSTHLMSGDQFLFELEQTGSQ